MISVNQFQIPKERPQHRRSADFQELYPIIYFDLRNTKESVTGDPKKLEFHYRLNEAANAQDYTIFAVVLNEEEFVLKQIGNELVAV